MKCRNGSCENEARYSVLPGAAVPTHCGLCDIEVNGGKGVLVKPHVCEHCGADLEAINARHEVWWQGVPGVGDLCDPCH